MTTPEFVTCYIEGTTYPRATCHQHHLNPRHAGGSDAEANLVWLSANAHQMVHRASQMIKAGKAGEAVDLANSAYSTPSQRSRFFDVVKEEVTASTLAKEAGRGNDFIIIEVPIPRAEYVRLKEKLRHVKINGKRLPIKEYVARLVLSTL